MFGSTKKNKARSVIVISLLAGLSFIGLAIVGWDLPPEKAAGFLLACVALLAVIILAAFIMVALINGLKRLFK